MSVVISLSGSWGKRIRPESTSLLSAQGTIMLCVTSLAVRYPLVRNCAKKRSWVCERFGMCCPLLHSSWHCWSLSLGRRVTVPRWQAHPHLVTQDRRSNESDQQCQLE